jgi:hypothetical protein
MKSAIGTNPNKELIKTTSKNHRVEQKREDNDRLDFIIIN